MKRGRKRLAPNQERLTVIIPKETGDYLRKKAKTSGLGNRSALLRYVITQMMNDEDLPRD